MAKSRKEMARERFSGPAFVREDSGSEKAQMRRRAVADAFDEADKGNFEPGIALGLFSDPDPPKQ